MRPETDRTGSMEAAALRCGTDRLALCRLREKLD